MFDAREAKALAPGAHLIVAAAPGLRLVASATTRTWVYRYRSPVDQSLRQVKIGRWPAMSLPAAMSEWERLRSIRDGGVDPAADRRAARAAVMVSQETYTVRMACDAYLSAYRGTVTDGTYEQAEYILGERFTAAIADRAASSITRAQAYDLIAAIKDTPSFASRLRSLLGAVWEQGHDSGRISQDAPNWWRQVLRGKLKSRGRLRDGEHIGNERRALSGPEVGQLLAFLPNFSRDVSDALQLYLWTCCRGAEIVAMERGEITEEPGGWWWTVPTEKQKMRRNELIQDLRVPLVGRALAVVQRRLAGPAGGYLFPRQKRAKDGHIGQTRITHAVWSHFDRCTSKPEWIRPRLAMPDWSPHDLRRTSRTMLAELRCPAEIAELLLGHIPPKIQATYDRSSRDAERREWITRLSDHLEGLAAGSSTQAR